MTSDLEKLTALLSKMNSIGNKIPEITQRPATIGHRGNISPARSSILSWKGWLPKKE